MNQPSQPKKILYIVTQGNWGGAQRYVFDLSTNLGHGYLPVVASGKESRILPEKLKNNGIKYIPIKNLVRNIHPVKDVKAIFEIYQLIKSEKPDIVHLNSSKAGALGAFGAKLAGTKKVIFTMHGLVLNEPLGIRSWLAYYLAEKISSYFKDQIIAVSVADKKSALKYGLKSEDKIKVIHIGIDPSSIDFLTRQICLKDQG